MFKKGDVVVVNDKCREPGLVHQKRIVYWNEREGLPILTSMPNGKGERFIAKQYLDKLEK